MAGAVIEGPDGLLLVQNRRRNGSTDWSTPGGVIDPGESVLEGLTREVAEETGLVVSAWSGPLYRVEVVAPALGWDLHVEVHAADSFTGDLVVDDPDGIVIDARFVPVGDHLELLAGNQPWVGEPLCEWVDVRWDHRRGPVPTFGFQLQGDSVSGATVTRTPR